MKLGDRAVALLGDVGDPEVATYGRYSAPMGAYAYRRQVNSLAPVETVTKLMTQLLQANLVCHGQKESASVEARFPVELTDAGRAHLEGLVT